MVLLGSVHAERAVRISTRSKGQGALLAKQGRLQGSGRAARAAKIAFLVN